MLHGLMYYFAQRFSAPEKFYFEYIMIQEKLLPYKGMEL